MGKLIAWSTSGLKRRSETRWTTFVGNVRHCFSAPLCLARSKTSLKRHWWTQSSSFGRAGAANLDVIQEVEYVKQEAKLVYLLKCLQKTPPPVLIFCENKSDVDDVHEYLLLKNVEAVAIHGGLDQEERHEAIKGFKEGTKDVLIGTDVASKGLDFPAIQHVI